MRYAVAALLVVHGLIHVPGFLKAWKLAELPSLSGRTIVHLSDGSLRVVGALWLNQLQSTATRHALLENHHHF